MGGNFTVSDDSHGIDQIGSSYRELLRFAQEVGITHFTYFEKGSPTKDSRFPDIAIRTTALSQVQSHPFFA